MVEVNELMPYRLEPAVIIHWSEEINRLSPETKPEKLAFLMDCFKTNKIQWDNKIGIQNIFIGLNQIEETETGFKVLKAIW